MERKTASLVGIALLSGLAIFSQSALFSQAAFAQGDGEDAPFASPFTPPERKVIQRMEMARELVAQERWVEAVQALGSILDLNEDFFYQPDRDKPEHRSLKGEAQRIIGSMPAEGRESYELQYGARARSLLEKALATGDVDGLAEVTRQYLHTKAGYQAMYVLGSHLYDTGRPLAAAKCFYELRQMEPAADLFEPGLTLKLIACRLRSGHDKVAEELLVDLKKRMPEARFEIAGQPVRLFDKNDQALAWFQQHIGPQRGPAGPREAEQWTMFRGSADRMIASNGGAALLEDKWDYWEVPLSHNDPFLEDLIDRRLESRVAGDEPIIPSFHPLVIGLKQPYHFKYNQDRPPLEVRDVVVMRTVRHLVGVDFATGIRMWDFSDDAIDSAEPLDSAGYQRNMAAFNNLIDQRLWQDTTFGMLASDGELVYSIYQRDDAFALTPNSGNERIIVRQNGARYNPGSTPPYNGLVAHDIRNGSMRWEIGGPEVEENHGPLELAGTYFLGPPLPLNGKLYVLGEKGEAVRLFALDAKTGEEEWSQQLAAVEFNISQDLNRRRMGLSPSYSDGMLVCPTGTGAIVAVDLTTRALSWGYQYKTNSDPGNRNRPFIAFGVGGRIIRGANGGDDSDRWSDASATIVGGKVLVTPIESDELHCLDLFSGEKLWSQKRDDGRYVATVHDGRAIVVGHNRVRAFLLEDGQPGWNGDYPAYPDGGSPSGRGFFNAGNYFLPLSTGQIVKINLADGETEVVSKFRQGSAPEQGATLGNLVCYRGSVVVQGVDVLAVYDQLDGLEQRVADQLKDNPQDAVALARYGEILLNRGEYKQAIAHLRKAHDLESDLRTRDLLLEAFLEGLRSDFASYRSDAEEIEELIDQPEQRAAYLRLMAGGLQDAGEHLEAFRWLMKFGDPRLGQPQMEKVDEHLSVRRDRWVLARLMSLRAAASEADRAEIDSFVLPRLEREDADAKLADLRTQLRHFGTYPQAHELRRELFTRLEGRSSALEAEQVLQPLLRSDDKQVAGEATALLAVRLRDIGRSDEAAHYYARLKSDFADVVVRDGMTGSELVEALPEVSEVRDALARSYSWPRNHIRLQREDSNNTMTRHYSLPLLSGGSPFFDDTSLELGANGPTVIARDELGRERWQVALGDPNARTRFHAQLSHAKAHGHVLVVSLGFSLVGIDTLVSASDGSAKVLWTRDVLPASADNGNYRAQPQPERTPWGEVRAATSIGRGRMLGHIGAVTDDYVCFQQQRDVLAIDTRTGETLWIRHNTTPGSDLFGDDDYVFIVPPGARTATVLRATDGLELKQVPVAAEQNRLTTLGRLVVTWEDAGDKGTQVSCTDTLENKQVWHYEFATGAKGNLLGEDRLGVLDPKGNFTLIDIRTGNKLIDTAQLDSVASLSEIFLFPSDWGFVMVANSPSTDQKTVVRPIFGGYGTYNSPAINGRVFGFDEQGQPMWSTKISDQGLASPQPGSLPLLIFACNLQTRLPNGQPVSRVAVTAIDKRTGQKVEHTDPTSYTSSFDLEVRPDENQIDVVLQRATVTLTLTDEAPPEEENEGEEKEGGENGEPSEVEQARANLKAQDSIEISTPEFEDKPSSIKSPKFTPNEDRPIEIASPKREEKPSAQKAEKK